MNNQIEGVNKLLTWKEAFKIVIVIYLGGGEGVVGERVTALTAFSFIFLLRYIFIQETKQETKIKPGILQEIPDFVNKLSRHLHSLHPCRSQYHLHPKSSYPPLSLTVTKRKSIAMAAWHLSTNLKEGLQVHPYWRVHNEISSWTSWNESRRQVCGRKIGCREP